MEKPGIESWRIHLKDNLIMLFLICLDLGGRGLDRVRLSRVSWTRVYDSNPLTVLSGRDILQTSYARLILDHRPQNQIEVLFQYSMRK